MSRPGYRVVYTTMCRWCDTTSITVQYYYQYCTNTTITIITTTRTTT